MQWRADGSWAAESRNSGGGAAALALTNFNWFKRRPNAARVTIGVQALVTDAESRVLLVRHGYRRGWHFPGGGVERNEPLERAMQRELLEETGVVATKSPVLFGLYSHFDHFPGDHIALYVISSWTQQADPAPNYEIAERGFFPIDALPSGTTAGVVRRIAEVMQGASRAQTW